MHSTVLLRSAGARSLRAHLTLTVGHRRRRGSPQLARYRARHLRRSVGSWKGGAQIATGIPATYLLYAAAAACII